MKRSLAKNFNSWIQNQRTQTIKELNVTKAINWNCLTKLNIQLTVMAVGNQYNMKEKNIVIVNCAKLTIANNASKTPKKLLNSTKEFQRFTRGS